MYTIRQIKKGLRQSFSNPALLFRELNRQYFKRKCGPEYNRSGIDIFEEEWDTLVVLDACRYDMFKEWNPFSAKTEKRVSRGSHTSEFLRGNFYNKTLSDTVYTTASPQLERRRDEIQVEFHDVRNIWNTNKWNEKEGTVHPKAMTEEVIKSHREYPHKRHLVHYMQPHYPFIDSSVDKDMRGFTPEPKSESSTGFDIWGEKMRGNTNVGKPDIWIAYCKNLNLVLNHITELLEADVVNGTIIITSDHGNTIGERAFPVPIREWGHPPGIYIDKLVTVPWCVAQKRGDRKILAESPTSKNNPIEETVVQDRLKELGYI